MSRSKLIGLWVFFSGIIQLNWFQIISQLWAHSSTSFRAHCVFGRRNHVLLQTIGLPFGGIRFSNDINIWFCILCAPRWMIYKRLLNNSRGGFIKSISVYHIGIVMVEIVFEVQASIKVIVLGRHIVMHKKKWEPKITRTMRLKNIAYYEMCIQAFRNWGFDPESCPPLNSTKYTHWKQLWQLKLLWLSWRQRTIQIQFVHALQFCPCLSNRFCYVTVNGVDCAFETTTKKNDACCDYQVKTGCDFMTNVLIKTKCLFSFSLFIHPLFVGRKSCGYNTNSEIQYYWNLLGLSFVILLQLLSDKCLPIWYIQLPEMFL